MTHVLVEQRELVGTLRLNRVSTITSTDYRPLDRAVTMTVDGVTTPIVPAHTYTGAITLDA